MFVLSVHTVLCKLQIAKIQNWSRVKQESCVFIIVGSGLHLHLIKNHAAQKHYFFFSQKYTKENFLKRVGCIFILQNFSSLGDH